jgi:predicted ATPase
MLVISGDVGVGKTRLALELLQRAVERDMATAVGQSISFLRDTVPYLPWTEIVRGLLNVTPGASPSDQLATVSDGMSRSGLEGWEPLLAEILGLPVRETSLTSALDPRMRQQRLFDLILELIAHHTRKGALVLWLEDLQWADVASLGLLDYVARNIRRLPILLMVTVRPVEHIADRWLDLPHSVELLMGELDESERAQLVAQLLQVPQVQESVLQGIVARAQGNPLFIEETVRAFTDAGVLVPEGDDWSLTTDPDTADVPDTVHGILQSRLDRLPETDRRILQVASVVGQSFAARVLDRVYPYGDLNESLPLRLEELSSKEFLIRAAPPSDYSFRHAMIQDVAYTSLPHARRRALHRDIAYMFEGSGDEEVAERLEFIALHFYRGRVWDRALPYLLQAGEKTQREYANEAAIAHFRRALRAIAELPDSAVDDQLEAYEGMSQVLTLLGRYDEALESLEEGWELVERQQWSEARDIRLAKLCRRMAGVYDPKGDYAAAFEWLERGLAIPGIEDTIEGAQLRRSGAAVLYRQGENSLAGEWCRNSLDIAEMLGDEEVLAQGNYSMGAILVRQGDFAGAVEHCRRSVSLYEKLGNLLGQSQAYNNLALAYDMQGDWGGAARYYRAASDILERIGYAEGQAMTATNLGEIFLLQGELDAASEQYHRALGIVERLGHPYGMALLNMNLGAVYSRGKRWNEALEHLERSLELFQEIGSEEFLAELCRHQAEVALGRGEIDQAVEHAQRSLDCVQAQGAEMEEGPTRRVLGRSLVQSGDLSRAKEELEQALALALEMDNRYEAARARLELGRLYIQIGESEEGMGLVRDAASLFKDLGASLDLQETDELLSG